MIKPIALLIALLVFISDLTALPNKTKPNILIILVDDLGYGDLSCQGGTDIHTPNIDYLFNKGVKFNRFYANCTVCSPTRASLLSGCYPDMVGVPGVIRTNKNNSWGYLKEDIPTLPDMLKKGGYRTALVGKWHLGLEAPNIPNQRGFDYFHGFLGDMMDNYWTHLRQGHNYMRLNESTIEPEGHATDIFSDWAADYITQTKNEEEPFFLFLAYNAPHFPIQPPEDWLNKVLEREGAISEKRAKNIAFVEHLDAGIGRVISALEASGQGRNTLIIFSSDNGGHLKSGASNGALRGGKQDMYEGGIRVPTVFVWKEKFKAKTYTNNLGLTMDIYPTLCEIAGVKVKHPIDGISLYRTLVGRQQNTSNRPVYFMRREGGHYAGLSYYAIRQGAYKLVQNSPYEEMQLFNLDTDPKEQIPLKQNSELYKELRDKLSQHIRRSGKIPWQN